MRRDHRCTARELLPLVAAGLEGRRYRTAYEERGDVLLYLADPDRPVGSVRLLPYCAEPLIWRWHVDHYLVQATRRAYEELGLRRRAWTRGPRPPRGFYVAAEGGRKLELSITAEQLETSAAYVHAWIVARDRHDAPPAPPWPLAAQRPDYQWSEDAAALYAGARRAAG